MRQMHCHRRLNATLAAGAAAALLLAGAPAAAGPSVLDSWVSVPMPAPPEVQAVTVDVAHTALLILDMSAANCTEAARPRCVRTLPSLQRLLADARAHKMMVIHSTGAVTSPAPPQFAAAVAPLPGETIIRTAVDKFFRSDLEKVLATGNITSVIVTGTSADGAVLYTASGAALRGLTAIVPLDGMSSVNPFSELYTAWHLKNSPAAIASHVTLTKTDLITLR